LTSLPWTVQSFKSHESTISLGWAGKYTCFLKLEKTEKNEHCWIISKFNRDRQAKGRAWAY
jgi:hypothetical protein